MRGAAVRYFTLSFIPQDIEKTEAGLRLYERCVLPHFAAGGQAAHSHLPLV